MFFVSAPPQYLSIEPRIIHRNFVTGDIKKKTASDGACGLSGDPRGVRTHDPILKRDVLYQLS